MLRQEAGGETRAEVEASSGAPRPCRLAQQSLRASCYCQPAQQERQAGLVGRKLAVVEHPVVHQAVALPVAALVLQAG